MIRILVVDDEEKMRHLLSIMLERRGYLVEQAGDGVEALKVLDTVHCDMVITDVKMPRMDGETLLKRIMKTDSPCPVVFITAFATVEAAVDAMRAGAVDYITKPFEEKRILLTVERTLNLSRIMAENRDLKKQASGSEEIVYGSPKMSEIMRLCARVAEGDTAVLITGESGTGKELLAKYIHTASPRRDKRFVPVNCAAISPSLVEAELFGHEKGAFTGAIRRNQGRFEYADGGTLFLDEIGDLSPEAQAKLLRALQEKKIQRVGGNEEIPVDVRVICATNQNLGELASRGDFRQDLYFRINVFPINVFPIEPPPLRDRTDDVVLLAKHFLHLMGGGSEIELTEGAQRVLREYTWPGNVRELANVMERAVILVGKGGCITADTLSFLRGPSPFGTECSSFQLPPHGIMLEEI
ncbi:MAG TPA: sigma-54 dependent transcriptional regulator, partial [Syntrophales bacterium]|nr:sigma-54 dependent transcriptional regulator [Syntrophales bacterium]